MHNERTDSRKAFPAALDDRSLKWLSIKIPGIYFLVAVFWIGLSDRLLALVVHNEAALTTLQSVKGMSFVLITAYILHWQLRRSLRTMGQIELALWQSRERLHLVLQNMPVMLNAFDERGRIMIWNQECEQVTGYSATEIVDNPQAMRLLYPDADYRRRIVADWAEEGNDYRNWEWDITCKDGSVRTIAWSNISDRFPIPGWGAWGIGVDITDRKRSEMALKRNEEFLHLALDLTHIGSWDWDLITNQVTWNANHARLLGLVPHEQAASYQAWRDRVHPEDVEHVEQIVAQSLETQTDFEAEYRVVYPDGSIHWLLGRGRGMAGETGQLIRMIGVIIDITERKQSEQEIRQLNHALEQQNLELEALVEQRTAALLTFINTLPDYIFVVERDTMRMPFCNDSIARLIGLESRHEVAGKTIFECFTPELAATFAAQNQQVFESGETLHFQESYTTSMGTLNFDTYKIPLTKPNGEVYALIGTSRDITELVEARQKIVDRTAQLEIINQELESFSYSVSHDLRAPLRHIHGFVAALDQKLQQNGHLTDPKVIHYLNVIQDSSRKMGHLIDGLLTLSRLGRRQMERVPVDLNQLVATVLTQFPEGLVAINATESIDGNLPVQFVLGNLPTVLGDATLLQQVFANLLSNALKFSRDRQPVRIEIDALADGTIFVRDQGVGFSMEYADQLFGAFQRLHSQSEFEGTGIGLAIVQRIIHRHGGEIWAESQPGQGATFYFTLGDRSTTTAPPMTINSNQSARN